MTDSPDAARYADPVLAGSRAGIARAITLVESSRPDHRVLAQHVLNRLQRVTWMWSLVRDQLLDRLRDSRELRAITPGLEADVRAGTLTPGLAAQQLIATFLPDPAIPADG